MSETTERARVGLRDELGAAEWQITESGFDPEQANTFETLFTVGNGRLGTRGTLEEGHVGEVSGTYLSGVYDGYQVPVIDLVNAPDWLSLGGDRERRAAGRPVLRRGRARARPRFPARPAVAADRVRRLRGPANPAGILRFASFADRRLCALRVEVTPLDHDAEVRVESALVGRRRNQERLPVYPEGTTFAPEVRWDKWAVAKHLVEVTKSEQPDAIYLQMRTIETGINLGYGAVLQSSQQPDRRAVQRSYERIEEHQHFTVGSGQTVRLDKLVSIATSRDRVDDVQARLPGEPQVPCRHGLRRQPPAQS